MEANEKRIILKNGGTAVVSKDCDQKTIDAVEALADAVRKKLKGKAMKTVVEEFMDDLEFGMERSFSENLRKDIRERALNEIREAWEDGYFAGLMDDTNDPDGFIKEKYPESFGNVKE